MPKNTKKVQNKKFHNNKTILLLIILLIVIGGGAFWQHYHKPTHVISTAASSTINYSPSTPKDNAANNARKGSSTPAPTLDNGATATTAVPLSITVTRASVVSPDLQVGTLVNGATNGSCTLNVSQGGQQTITQTESVQQQNNAYSCPVFNIPLSEFPNQNNWNVSVTVTSNGQSQSGQWQANPVNLSSSD
jgi:hypothetical protein